ncbi:hypothetical protein ES702_02313 [subsurface metagenome]
MKKSYLDGNERLTERDCKGLFHWAEKFQFKAMWILKAVGSIAFFTFAFYYLIEVVKNAV